LSAESPARLSGLWRAAALVVLVAAAWLRTYDLERKPLHHDEGVNGFFLTKLVRQGVYEYDPNNYHGPTLYYLSLLPVAARGLDTIAIRLVPAVTGLATVAIVLGLGSVIGRWGALAAAGLLAVSPGAVYFSRYFIHESLVVLFTLATVAAATRIRGPAARAAPLLAALAAALLFATKETALVHAGVLVCAYALARWLHRGVAGARQELGSLLRKLWTSGALALFIAVNLLFYSSFFSHPAGIVDAFRSLAVWSRTGTSAHLNPWYQYLIWLCKAETGLLVLGGLGLVVAARQRRHSCAPAFVAFWALGMLAAYSLVPYKTPWLGLNVALPLALLSGHALEWLGGRSRALALGAAVLALGISGWQAVTLSFERYDDDRLSYVYAHTRRGFLDLVRDIEAIAATSGHAQTLPVTVTSPEHWPLPWYLRDYPHAGYYGKIPQPVAGLVVVGAVGQVDELMSTLGPAYPMRGLYPLRPGVELVLFVKNEDADASPPDAAEP